MRTGMTKLSVKVIKIGGAFLDDSSLSKPFFRALAHAQQHNAIVLIHGGGSTVEKWLTELRLTSSKINGLRVTPDEHIDYVTGALAGTVNKRLCGLALQSGLNPVGISLMDGKTSVSQQINQNLGNVGEVIETDGTLLTTLLAGDFLPIVSSIGADANGKLLNINADQAAVAVAKALQANLMLLSDVQGVWDQHKQLLPTLNAEQITTLIEQDVIQGGMAVKVNAALEAANTIGQPVTIASWLDIEAIAKLTTDAQSCSVGTTIYPQESEL